MTFVNHPPLHYNAADSRALLEQPNIETETPWNIHKSVYRTFDQASSEKYEVGENTSSSFYMDTDKLTLFRSCGITLRIRKGNVEINHSPGGKKSEGITFPKFQFALKRKHSEWQQVSNNAARLILPDYESDGSYPKIRTEAEGSIEEPEGIKQFLISDLPQKPFGEKGFSIAEEIERLILNKELEGITDPRHLIIHPWVMTKVMRRRTTMYLDPEVQYDFVKKWPAKNPTKKMLDSKQYLAIEIALDRMKIFKCPDDKSITEMVSMSRSDFRDQFTQLGKERFLLEYEIKPEYSSANLTDLQAIAAYTLFGRGLLDYAHDITSGDWGLTPAYSKAVTAYGLHPACRPEGGHLYRPYTESLGLAA